MRIPESRARRYGRERSYSYLVQPVKKVDKQKITKDEFRKLMQKGADEIERLKAEREKEPITFCPKCNRLTEYDSHFNRRVCTNAKCNWRGAKGAK